MRLTKFNPETGEYEYIEKAKTQAEFNAQRKAVIQRLGEFEDKASEERQEEVMSRYIDADKLVAWCNETFQAQSTTAGRAYINAFLTAVDSCPTADVVKVVRCRDCRWWTKQKDSVQGRCGMYGRYPTGAWYCANGERREE